MAPYSDLLLKCSVSPTELLVFYFTTNWELFGVVEECIQFGEHCLQRESPKPVVNSVPEV